MKDLSKHIVVKELINSLACLKKNPLLVILASIVDAVFFVAYGFFSSPIGDQIAAHAILISNKVSPMIAAGQTGIVYKLFQDPLRAITGKLFIILFMYFAVLYLVYVIFQGCSWYIATQISKKKPRFKEYFIGFAKLNVVL